MNILHITPHLGGGVGTVIMDWMEKEREPKHMVMCLDYMNKKAKDTCFHKLLPQLSFENMINESKRKVLETFIKTADIVLVHYWDHPMLAELFSRPLPGCRMVFWCHKHYSVPERMVKYPDRYINTSPIQDNMFKRSIWKDSMEYIWSTGNMERFLAIEPKEHEGFNIGTLVSKKMDLTQVYFLFLDIKRKIPEARFTWIGDDIPRTNVTNPDFNFAGKVDDVAPYLAEMDVFAYPLRPDHYGTCEIALGEAMAAGVVPVVMRNPAEQEIILDGVTGFTAYSEREFIKAIQHLNKDSFSRISTGKRARIRANDLYSIDKMIASWNKVFEEMMEKPKTKKETL